MILRNYDFHYYVKSTVKNSKINMHRGLKKMYLAVDFITHSRMVYF